MKITKTQLRQIIREEIQIQNLNEAKTPIYWNPSSAEWKKKRNLVLINKNVGKLTDIPDFPSAAPKEYTIDGCNKLTTLEGSPKTAGHVNIIDNNNLKSLKGMPTTIKGPLNIRYCESLTSLEGLSNVKVKGKFGIHNKSITSLKGSPKSVPGDWDVFGSYKTLAGCTSKVGGSFNAASRVLTSLVGGPTSVGNDYYVAFEPKIKDLTGVPSIINGNFAPGDGTLSCKNGPKTVKGDYMYYGNKFTSKDVLKYTKVGGTFMGSSHFLGK
jgi:hypothetical protein